MLDVRKTLVSKLKEVSTNTMYELEVETPTLPLITYTTIDDNVLAYGSTVGYSNIKFQIKVWAQSLQEIASYTTSIDNKLTDLGLRRTYYNELHNGEVIIGVMQYQGLIQEQFGGYV